MNTTTLKGEGQEIGGSLKEAAGKAIGDNGLASEGFADRIAGSGKQVIGALTDALSDPQTLFDKAKTFARERPYATAALVGVLGLATFNTLRGK
ncbi:CsbD family protein [Sphingomonas immobilis]|uniref:CsbD family protein n=1 Tax=Sphingomonas immobilis TaxID=3063997 RepID=A0ABT8ZZP8_9SPHN|nr:CsbD family protein [Sphingomonas sp. CA1-15]MDO7841927.1 CsbD family protein [Sphingomonas sp. CA1-15]